MANIFVLLPAHMDNDKWAEGFKAGKSADSSCWGFGHAERFGHVVQFSKGRDRGRLERLLRWLLDVDVLHAWINRRNIRNADIVITHTEREYLAAALVLKLYPSKKVMLQGNTLWMFANSLGLRFWQKYFASTVIGRVDIHTCNARPNVAGAEVYGIKHMHYVPYGISTDTFPITPPRLRDSGVIVAIGNDISRDWDTLEGVVRRFSDRNFRVATGKALPNLAAHPNVEVRPTNGMVETNALYDEARAVLVFTTPNFHASGITVVLEAVARGVPVVCSMEGGLDGYFGEEHLWFFGETCRFKTAEEALESLLQNPDSGQKRAELAQELFISNEYNSVDFVKRLLNLIEHSENVQ